MLTMFRKSFVLAFLFVVFSFCSAWAGDNDVEDLKKRVEELEKKVEGTQVVVDEPGHKLHPIHSLYGLKVSGDITMSAHGVSRLKGDQRQRGAAVLSADLALETPIGKTGRAVVVLDMERGAGIHNLPAFFTSPNGNTSGYNADIESFNDTSVHLTQAYYESDLIEGLTITVGQLNVAGYFDINRYANDERSQFMANLFVNNPAIEFGGDENFYGPGVRVTWAPSGKAYVTAGAFTGDGNYDNAFDSPFLMVEAGTAIKPFGKEGNYRLNYWYRSKRPDTSDPATAIAENVANPNNTALLNQFNNGVGVSIDQDITDALGVWLRAGVQRETVAQFDRFIGAGVNVCGCVFGREKDHIGFGYGAAFMGSDYKDYKKGVDPAFDSGTEHYFELYYNYALADYAADEGFHISPDIQYVINPGGDRDASKMFIYGVRLQAYF